MATPTNASSRDFMQVDNFKHMISLFKRFLLEKHSINIDATTIDLKRTLLDTMEKVHADLRNSATTREMNEITLKSIKNTVLKALVSEPVSTQDPVANGNGSGLARDNTLYGKRNINSAGHLLPEITTVKNDNASTAVMEQFEQIRVARDATTPRGSSVQQAKSIEAFEEVKPLDDAEFQARLKALQATRLQQQQQQQNEVPPPSSLPPSSESVKTDVFPETGFGSLTLDRNSLIVDVRDQNEGFDPKSIFVKPLPQQQLQLKLTLPSHQDTPDTNQVLSVQSSNSVPYVTQERYILANSIDRDWLQQGYRYKYKVRFTRSTQDAIRVPIYENNETVPFTRTLTTRGISNIAGYYDDTGVFRPAYQSGGPLGAEIGSETIVLPVDNNANVQTNFRNIYSVQVTNVVIPMDVVVAATPFGNFTTATTTGGATAKNIFNYDFNFNFPYLLLQIDEFRDIYDGTDDAIRSSFCQLVYYKSYQSNTGRGYVVLRPAQNEKKVFYPAALSTLPTLSMSLLRPNGQLLNQSRDGLSIMKIEHSTDQNTLYLQIFANKFFDKNEYCQGDNVQFKAYSLFKIADSQRNTDIERFNAFINKAEGHEVVSVGAANNAGYYRSFFIRAPSNFDESQGRVILDETAVQQLDIFNTTMSTDSIVAAAYAADIDNGRIQNGFILNMSLQNSISLKLEQKIHDSSAIGSINV